MPAPANRAITAPDTIRKWQRQHQAFIDSDDDSIAGVELNVAFDRDPLFL
jgi:hypothetical protein